MLRRTQKLNSMKSSATIESKKVSKCNTYTHTLAYAHLAARINAKNYYCRADNVIIGDSNSGTSYIYIYIYGLYGSTY